ncbi:hypothetical protein [Paenibacillus sp. y28]|uniref:hypothetical protein n=1 Tax=Paenibacillus sp. y28 TaxID=3129110 RepID=UPI003015D506
MNREQAVNGALIRQREWLEMAEGQARCILGLLDQDSVERDTAGHFSMVYGGLLEQAKRGLSASAMSQLNLLAFETTRQFRAFMLQLLREHLVNRTDKQCALGGKTEPDEAINEMLHELDIYLAWLRAVMAGEPSDLLPRRGRAEPAQPGGAVLV